MRGAERGGRGEDVRAAKWLDRAPRAQASRCVAGQPGRQPPRDWRSALGANAEFAHHHLHVCPHQFLGFGVAQQIGRVVSDQHSRAMERMEALQLRNSLAALPPLQREAIVLAYFGPLTYREVAERLSKPLPTIKSRIRDGLKQLREQLEPA